MAAHEVVTCDRKCATVVGGDRGVGVVGQSPGEGEGSGIHHRATSVSAVAGESDGVGADFGQAVGAGVARAIGRAGAVAPHGDLGLGNFRDGRPDQQTGREDRREADHIGEMLAPRSDFFHPFRWGKIT